MAYKELIKNFEKIRAYMRDFYVYGFKSRSDFDRKSLRAYDDERRRIESYLGNYMQFNNFVDGKNVFISIDSRRTEHNPLYKAWKAKSFTDGDITLHFIIFDILNKAQSPLTLGEITNMIDVSYLSCFENPVTFDESTVRKKLKEYACTGIVKMEKKGNKTFYSVSEYNDISGMGDVLDFFSETAPLGVVGSYLLDKVENHKSKFSFKHHYITNTIDSGVMYDLLIAINEKRYINAKAISSRSKNEKLCNIVPLKIFISTQSGRSYLVGYSMERNRIASYRLDSLSGIKMGEVCNRFDELAEIMGCMQKNLWGASIGDGMGTTHRVEFTVFADKNEDYIVNRLEKEKRIGKIERLDENHYRFSADVVDEYELVPWIRTFICRITDISFTDKGLERRFKKDLEAMYSIYGVGGAEK